MSYSGTSKVDSVIIFNIVGHPEIVKSIQVQPYNHIYV